MSAQPCKHTLHKVREQSCHQLTPPGLEEGRASPKFTFLVLRATPPKRTPNFSDPSRDSSLEEEGNGCAPVAPASSPSRLHRKATRENINVRVRVKTRGKTQQRSEARQASEGQKRNGQSEVGAQADAGCRESVSTGDTPSDRSVGL